MYIIIKILICSYNRNKQKFYKKLHTKILVLVNSYALLNLRCDRQLIELPFPNCRPNLGHK